MHVIVGLVIGEWETMVSEGDNPLPPHTCFDILKERNNIELHEETTMNQSIKERKRIRP
jgi:hypothetical protein